ncbi:MAG: diguanylate cyclase domain-containing protein [Comamonas sp.]
MHLLQNLVQMTGQRDHWRLEISVLSTFLELSYIEDVRTLELAQIEGQYWFRPRVWRQDGQFQSVDLDILQDPQLQPLPSLPALHHCVLEQHPQATAQLGHRQHVLWLPVWRQNHVHACIEITQSQAFRKNRLDVITGVFSVYRNYQSLLDYSERDALTGLLNRKTFEEHLLRLTAHHTASAESSAWLAVIDIDYFKQVNDRYGHLFGDEVLILVANLLRQNFTAQHRMFRFGGEEFVVLMPPMALPHAHALLENFRAQVAQYAFPQLGHVTVSIGFSGAHGSSPVELLGHADQALYYAKANGRNQICHYEAVLAQGLLQQPSITHEDIELF